MTQLAHSHRLRTGRHSETGRADPLTTVVQQRRPVFVLMPDHLHRLVQVQRGTLPQLMQRFKSRSAAAINGELGCRGQKLWQAGYHDPAVRDGQDIRALARYVMANPLRAGLVRRVGDYPHGDAAWM